MFGLLKQKLSGFLDKLTGREEQKAEAQAPDEEKKPAVVENQPPEPELPLAKAPETIKASEKEKIEKTQAAPPKKAQEKKPAPEIKAEAKKPKETEAKIAPAPKAQEKKIVPEAPAMKMPEKKVAPVAATAPEAKEIAVEKVESQEPVVPTAQKPVEAKVAAPEKVVEKKEAPAQKQGFAISNIWPFGKKEETQAQKVEMRNPQPAAPALPKTPAMEAKPAGVIAPPAKEVAAPAHDETDFNSLQRKSQSGQKKMEVRMGLAKSVTSFFSSEVKITEEDVKDLVDELELAMLEADVAYDVSVEVTSKLRNELVGMSVRKGGMHAQVREAVAKVIAGVLSSGKEFDFVERVRGLPKPVKVLFIGPNGAGKTTTMAKIAKKLSDEGMTCVFAAADTFRAAAIEQLEVHAKNLDMPMIKAKYGSDPAAVAFDAVQYAKAHSIDVVLIDSSGRQDTNANLLDELKKIVRVIKPDLKIYIGESIGGNATVDQIRGFADSVGLDGVVLTKLDCDAKGGTALSVSHSTGVPILYFGIGQNYADLQEFSAKDLANSLVNPPAAS